MGRGKFQNLLLFILWCLVIFLFLASLAWGQNLPKDQLYKSNSLQAEPSIVKFNINNISTYIYWDGRMDVKSGNSGFEYPKGSGKYCVYESGFIFAGKADSQEIRLGGSTFHSGMVGGYIDEYGKTQPPDDPLNRIFRVRPDWQTADFYSEINDGEFGGDVVMIRAQYKKDWMEWPWNHGAPYLDADGNGIYDPDPDGNGQYDLGEDIPGHQGADQTIFFITNHSNGDIARRFYGSPRTNFEMQVTIWGYNSASQLGNMIFKEYTLINKDSVDYTDFYCGIWCDPDNGGAGDDFVGCDTLLNLGFCYNADNDDNQYSNNPPASGHVILKNNGRSFNNNKVMTSFNYEVNENGVPGIWYEDIYTWTLHHYSLLQGKIYLINEFFQIPEELGGGTTKYPLSGDPVTGAGYVDGIIKPADDRRYQLSTGPFYFASGDTVTITLAQIAAGGRPGIDRLQAITLLKEYTQSAIDFADNNFLMPRTNQIQSFSSSTNELGIHLTWGNGAESFERINYKFQGYNIYQLPEANSPITEGVRVKTFDVVDGIREIAEEYYYQNVECVRVIQYGNDWGIENELLVTRDHLRNTYLRPGSEYHFAITSYVYNEDAWAGTPAFESEPSYVTVTYQGEEGPDIERINVFPNPYYGANPNELNKYQRFVTFSHLPEQATIRIFNLAGQLIKTIYKSEPGQFQRWDLMNDHNFLVPGGIYIAYIEMPELGETKILKLAVVTENIIPDYY